MNSPILKAEGLQKYFDTGAARTMVLPGLELSFRQGEFAVIMGNSGSGKSTLLYLLSGLDQPSAGQVSIAGDSLYGKTERQLALLRRDQVGFVFQQYHLIPNLTLLENVLLPGLLGRKKRRGVIEQANELFRQLDIDGLQHRRPAEVSGGEQQRCCIARALINEPNILMADEPTGNLNSSASAKVLDCLSEIHDRGQTVIMVTHHPQSACRGERVLFLKDGSVLDEFIFQNDLNDPAAREQALVEWLGKQGW